MYPVCTGVQHSELTPTFAVAQPVFAADHVSSPSCGENREPQFFLLPLLAFWRFGGSISGSALSPFEVRSRAPSRNFGAWQRVRNSAAVRGAMRDCERPLSGHWSERDAGS